MSRWVYAWLGWAAVFAYIEVPALLNSTPNDTLSEQIGQVVALHPLLWVAGALFMAWLCYHFLWEMPRRYWRRKR